VTEPIDRLRLHNGPEFIAAAILEGGQVNLAGEVNPGPGFNGSPEGEITLAVRAVCCLVAIVLSAGCGAGTLVEYLRSL
jgi:hypothetical protein